MSKKVSKAMERRSKMQERMDKMEKEMKELEAKAFEEVGKFLFKEWEINGEVDSAIIFEAITLLKDDAISHLNSDEVSIEMGKSEELETLKTL